MKRATLKPVYTLKDESLNQKATQLLLQDVRIEGGQLHVKIGMG